MKQVEAYGKEKMNSISMTKDIAQGVKCVKLCPVKDISNHQSAHCQDQALV